MTRIVTTHYRYKRPPRKRKAIAIDVPAIVTRASKRAKELAPVPTESAPPTNADRKPAIVTTTSKRNRARQRREVADAVEVSAEVKAFFERMVRPGGALPPVKK